MQQTVVTHDGDFHADDVFGVAALQLLLGVENVRVVRTRDEALIRSGDWVLDVGGLYDADARRFDHHQNDAPVRENGIPYAAFGLVWKHFGEQLAGSSEAAALVENALVIPIDAEDNGVSLYTLTHPPLKPFGTHDVITTFRPPWGSTGDVDAQFLRAVTCAREILTNAIAHAKADIQLRQLIQHTYNAADDKRILVFEIPISTDSLIDYPNVHVAVYPDNPGTNAQWIASTIRTDHDGFVPRVQFPALWAGLRDDDLVAVSGITDAVFSHKGRFFFVARSRESALSAATQAS